MEPKHDNSAFERTGIQESPMWGRPGSNSSPLMRYIIIVLFVLLGFGFGIIIGRSSDVRKLAELREENSLLRGKLELYEAVIDSIYQRLNLIEEDRDEISGYPNVDDISLHYGSSVDELLKRSMHNLEKRLVSILQNTKEERQSRPAVTGNVPAIYPTFGRISDGWGMRIHPISNRLEFHHGIDIANNEGTAVYATATGKVSKADFDQGFGKRVFIDHGNGYTTLYAHLDIQRVKVGEEVEKGQIIGLMGSTGLSTGPHLHYEVHFRGQKLNPSLYLNRIESYASR
ncbi:MAG: M23 family metallopeptidase [Candidatus Cloacimonetes bacterium]|jgi:murein DD-endopeptidase MepM/ murein hydrolase activator NlpD|nr:M23 family metallopeptidase [Candidatus Cloacimonadota bacterium]